MSFILFSDLKSWILSGVLLSYLLSFDLLGELHFSGENILLEYCFKGVTF
jgi:hypothetical protein